MSVEYVKYYDEQICIKCKSNNVGTKGKYKIKYFPYIKQKYRCRDCNKYFTLRDDYFRKNIRKEIKYLIKEYSTKTKESYNKFDNTKSLKYSTREIVGLIKKNHNAKISKSFVAKFLRNNL